MHAQRKHTAEQRGRGADDQPAERGVARAADLGEQHGQSGHEQQQRSRGKRIGGGA